MTTKKSERAKNFGRQLTATQRDEIRRLSAQGLSIGQIMARVGCSYAAALRHADDAAFDTRGDRPLCYGVYTVPPVYRDFEMKQS